MSEELTEEQKQLAAETLLKKQNEGNNNSNEQPKENNNNDNNNNSNGEGSENDSEFLANAKKLKEGQEKLIAEREKLESDKKEFNNIMAGQEQRGRAMAGTKEPSQDEKDKESAMSLVAGTGLDPFA